MRRYFVRAGDRTTTGGVVIEGLPDCDMFGAPASYHGATVACRACKSVGVIRCIPPMSPFTLTNRQQVALDGDLCICKCKVPPRLLAGQVLAYEDFGPSELESMGLSAAGTPLPVPIGGQPADATASDAATPAAMLDLGEYSERLAIFDPITGEMATTAYALYQGQAQVAAGTSSDEGYTTRHENDQPSPIKALIGDSAPWTADYRADEGDD